MDDTFCSSSSPLTPASQARQDEDRSVQRMQRLFPDKLRDLCHMHLAFILDLSDQKLEEMITEEAGTSSRGVLNSISNIFGKRDKSRDNPFASPLTEHGVYLMMPLIAFLRKGDNIKKEGLFRKAGNGRKMKLLKEQLISKGADIVIDSELFGSHDVACVLKEFLRELPEPLLTYRHMEAYRQIRGLGLHATSAEEKERYFHKKLSATQYLMRLIPEAVQKMVRHLMKLLHKVTREPETKMTAETLGTIFAPICCLDRKAAASDVCDLVSETEPTVAFMIENATRLFEVPKPMVADVISFFKDVEQEKLQSSAKLKKWPSGPIVNTNVCYIDRAAAQSEDVASHTQAELASLYAHVASLPDTPHNIKLKKQIQKSTPTSASLNSSCSNNNTTHANREHNRSRSIGRSIKKRLPSLTRSKKYSSHDFSYLSSEGSYRSHDCLNNSVMSDLITSPPPTRGRASTRESRPRQKRNHMQATAGRAAPDCTPPKLERRARSIDVLCTTPNESENAPPASIQLTSTPAKKHGASCTLGNCRCGRDQLNASNIMGSNSNILNKQLNISNIVGGGNITNTTTTTKHSSNNKATKVATTTTTAASDLCPPTPLTPVTASALTFAHAKMECMAHKDMETLEYLTYCHSPNSHSSHSSHSSDSSNTSHDALHPAHIMTTAAHDASHVSPHPSKASRVLLMHTPPDDTDSGGSTAVYRRPATPIMKRAVLSVAPATVSYETAL